MSRLRRLVANPHLQAALILAGVLVVFYRDVVFGGKTFLTENSGAAGTMGDAGPYGYPQPPIIWYRLGAVDRGANAWVHEPSAYHLGDALRHGEFPLWDPHSGLGQPWLAAGQAGALEPLQTVFNLAPQSTWHYATDIQWLLRLWLAGFFTYLLLVELGLTFTPALFGGIAFMLANYLVNFGIHPQSRADTLMPLVLYGYERLVRRPGTASLLVCIGAIVWVVLADFPEATFVSLQLGTLWYLYRAVWAAYDARFAGTVVRPLLKNGVAAIGCALGLAAFYVLPLLENVSQSHHYHAKGTGMMPLTDWMTILTLVPGYFVLGLQWAPHYLLTVVLLAVAGAAGARRVPGHARVALFFGVYFLLVYAKSYGAPWADWIAMLPAYNQLNFPKYMTPSLELSLLILAALGLDSMVKKGPSCRLIAAGALFIAAVIGAFWYWIPLPPAEPAMFGRQLIKVLGIVSAGVAIVAVARIMKADPRKAAFAFVALLVCESLFWHRHVRRPERYHSFTTPPFVEFLRKEKEPFRIFSRDMVLYPNTAMAFGLDDIRYLVALDPARRKAFYERCITPGYLDVRVGGTETEFYFTKFFDLLNTKYILSMPPGAMPRTALPLAAAPPSRDCFTRPGGPAAIRTVTLDGDAYRAVCMRAPAEVPCPVTIPIGASKLYVALGLDPSKTPPGSAGVEFRVTLMDAGGAHEVLRRRVDPQHNPGENGWSLVSADLSRWSGQEVVLTFATGGSSADTGAAWACWAEPTLVADRGQAQDAAPAGVRPLNREIIEQNMLQVSAGFMPAAVIVDGQTRGTIFMQPDCRARLPVTLSGNETFLRFSIEVDPLACSLGVGDGATFKVAVRDTAGETQVYSRYLDPKHNESERRWFDETVDLGKWKGQHVTLFFAVDGGPAGDNRTDWVHWANVELSAQRTGPPVPQRAEYDVVYSGEVTIYRNNHASPRAFVVHNVEPAASVAEALTILSRPNFDPRTTAVVEGVTPQGWDSALFSKNTASPATPAEVVERGANSMRIKATLDKPGVLVVSDTYFPGWKASVDGAAAPVLPVDVALRGVYLQAGAHDVLLYYSPWPFNLGAAISVCAFLGLAGWVIWRRRRTREA